MECGGRNPSTRRIIDDRLMSVELGDHSAAFYRPEYKEHQFQLDVVPVCTVGPVGRKFLMGGVNTAAAVEAAEQYCGRPLLTISSQFLSFAALGDRVSIGVDKLSEGRSVTQANIVNRVGDREILQASASLGDRDVSEDTQFFQAPDVAHPEDCDPAPADNLDTSDLGSITEKRVCVEDSDAGVGITWIKISDDAPVTAAKIALVADYLAGAIPRTRGASSLDNHLRVISRHETEWFLCQTRMAAFTRGFLHGETRLFSEDGRLLALASQSAALPNEGGEWAQSQAKFR